MTHICDCKSHLSIQNINTILKYLNEKHIELTNKYYSYSLDYMSEDIQKERASISNIISTLNHLKGKSIEDWR